MTDRLSTAEIQHIYTLSAMGKSYRAIARATGRDPKTIAYNLKKEDAVQTVAHIKTELADEFETLARRMISSITDDDISKINAYQRTIAAAAATDKQRLLTGQSTQNITTMMARLVIETED